MKKKFSVQVTVLLICFFTGTLVGFTAAMSSSQPVAEVVEGEGKVVVVSHIEEFSPERFKALLIELNVKYPDIVYAQAVLETGNFTSKVFLENNNLFGMKQAAVRANTAITTKNNHAYYKNWRESVIDYALYQSTYLRKLSRQEYMQYIEQNYAADPTYVNKLTQIINRNKS